MEAGVWREDVKSATFVYISKVGDFVVCDCNLIYGALPAQGTMSLRDFWSYVGLLQRNINTRTWVPPIVCSVVLARGIEGHASTVDWYTVA